MCVLTVPAFLNINSMLLLQFQFEVQYQKEVQLNLRASLVLDQQVEIKLVHDNEQYRPRPIVACKCHAGEGDPPFEVVRGDNFATVHVWDINGHFSAIIKCIGASVNTLSLKFPTFSSCHGASKF